MKQETATMETYEFMGPVFGPLAIIFGLPLVCLLLGVASGPVPLHSLLAEMKESLSEGDIFSWQGLILAVGWFMCILSLHILLPGKVLEGVTLEDGKRLKYKLNGFTVLIVVYSASLATVLFWPSVNLSWIHTNWLQAVTGSILFSFAISTYLYLSSFHKGCLRSAAGKSPSQIYNFFIGRELNPRIGSVDLKEFCELYPGLIGWVLINLAMAHKQWTQFGRVTNSMVIVNCFHLLYVADGLWFEPGILTTMDITTDGFGFMLGFGDLTWVPFTYSLQAKFLADTPVDLAPWQAVCVVALQLAGYAAFRGANSQKDMFRRDPDHPSVRSLKTMKTDRGTRLIISSWWGLARHINYTGDWLMGLAWCLTTGCSSIVPYFYAVYFAVLLIHRDRRDEHSCRQKYGKDWDKYCALVPYRFIPHIY